MYVMADINECLENMTMCVDYATCINTVGTYTCICDSGFTGDGFVNCSSKMLLLFLPLREKVFTLILLL